MINFTESNTGGIIFISNLGFSTEQSKKEQEMGHRLYDEAREQQNKIQYKNYLTSKELSDMEEVKETGVKLNQGKPELSLLFKQFPKALEAIAKCSEYGHTKYKETDTDYLNFKRVPGGSKAYADAGLRHRLFKEGTTDLDSQLPHSFHTAWNALAELELILENK